MSAKAPPLPPFLVGDPVPWFELPTTQQANFKLSAAAGRYIVLTLLGRLGSAQRKARLAGVLADRARFDDDRLTCFAVLSDAEVAGLPEAGVGLRYFVDPEGAVDARFRPPDGAGVTYVLDPMLRVLGAIRFDDPQGHDRRLGALLKALPEPDRHGGPAPHAPVLIVPRVFEPGLCRELIQLYERQGGEDSGFMREVDGKTVSVLDHNFKRRRDFSIADAAMRDFLMRRIHRRLVPEIQKAYQFNATRMERYLIACYEAEGGGGYFRAHRDNTTKGTAHRRFAVTVNLNAEEYEGGDLRFPEFGRRTYRPPTGGAVVFACNLQHEATPVTRGRRYAFLPFLYDAEGQAIRERNAALMEQARPAEAAAG